LIGFTSPSFYGSRKHPKLGRCSNPIDIPIPHYSLFMFVFFIYWDENRRALNGVDPYSMARQGIIAIIM
jgi:hypothetical protein